MTNFQDVATDQFLTFGSKGKGVTQLQERMEALGIHLPNFGADGDFGGETLGAVFKLQKLLKEKGLYKGEIDGKAGHDTLTGLNEAIHQLQKPEKAKASEPPKPAPDPQAEAKRLAAQQAANRAELTKNTGRDPSKLLFVSYDKNNPQKHDEKNNSWTGDYAPTFESSGQTIMGGNPSVYHLNSAKQGINDPKWVIGTINAHTQKYGVHKPLEIFVDGHGGTNNIGTTAPLNTLEFLRELKSYQDFRGGKDNFPVGRITFGGCEVFSNLSKEDQAKYQALAHSIGAEIVGSTSIVWSGEKSRSGHFVNFSPDGGVKWDKLTNFEDYNQSAKMKDELQRTAKNEKWLGDHGLIPSATPKVAANTQRGKEGSVATGH